MYSYWETQLKKIIMGESCKEWLKVIKALKYIQYEKITPKKFQKQNVNFLLYTLWFLVILVWTYKIVALFMNLNGGLPHTTLPSVITQPAITCNNPSLPDLFVRSDHNSPDWEAEQLCKERYIRGWKNYADVSSYNPTCAPLFSAVPLSNTKSITQSGGSAWSFLDVTDAPGYGATNVTEHGCSCKLRSKWIWPLSLFSLIFLVVLS